VAEVEDKEGPEMSMSPIHLLPLGSDSIGARS
jgi:hypothetical protein